MLTRGLEDGKLRRFCLGSARVPAAEMAGVEEVWTLKMKYGSRENVVHKTCGE